jgi:hypothetical protein
MTAIKILTTFLLNILCLTMCAQSKPATSTNVQFKQKDTSYWVDNFRQFREALYQRDKSKAKAFFDFPFVNEGNEIWYLAYSDNDEAVNKLDTTVKPFTENDLDKYFDKVFSRRLVKCFLKIKIDELYKKGKSGSPEFKDGSTTYKLYAAYNKADRIVELNFATSTPYKISSTEYEAGESNFIYYFQILADGHIKFIKILMAG